MHAMSFYVMVYQFVHSSTKTTPAMEAGAADFLWTMEVIVVMAETNRCVQNSGKQPRRWK